MAASDVGNFMAHHASQFRFRFGSHNQPGIHVEEATGKGEGINVVAFHHFNGERDLRIRIPDQILPNAADILRY